VCVFHPESSVFLKYECVEPLAAHYEINLEALKAELIILPQTIERFESEKNVKITNILQFLDMLYNSYLCDKLSKLIFTGALALVGRAT
jgi:hypothetical protein